MTSCTAVAEEERIQWTMEQVPLGAIVQVCEPGTRRLGEVRGKLVPPLQKLAGGVPLGANLYMLLPNGKFGSSYRSVPEEARFTPTEVFTPEGAPVNTNYVAFLGGELLMYEARPGYSEWDRYIELNKGSDGHFVIISRSSRRRVREYELPPGVQLVAIGEVGQADLSPPEPA